MSWIEKILDLEYKSKPPYTPDRLMLGALVAQVCISILQL